MKNIVWVFALLLTACLQPVSAANSTPSAFGTSPKIEERDFRGGKETTMSAPTATNTAVPTVTVCGNWNVRPVPAPSGFVRLLKPGDSVTVFEWSKGWARIGAGEWVNGRAVCDEK